MYLAQHAAGDGSEDDECDGRDSHAKVGGNCIGSTPAPAHPCYDQRRNAARAGRVTASSARPPAATAKVP